MRNSLILGIYSPFAALTAVIFCIELLRHHKRREDTYFTLLCFYALGWYAVNIWGLLSPSEAVAEYCLELMLIFVSLITPTLLQFILRFYKFELPFKLPFKLPKYAPLLLYIIPAITSVLAIFSPYHTLLATKLDIISLSPIREMEIVWGPWFWVHTVYSYIISMLIIACIIYQHRRSSRFYRLPSTMMVLGVGITLLGNLVTLLQVISPVIEPTLITMSLSLIFFSLAIYNNNNSKFVRYSRAHIYQYLAEYILVLDNKNQVIDHNKSAEDWFSSMGITLHNATLEGVMEALGQKGAMMCQLGGEDTPLQEGIDIHMHDNMFQLILNQRIYHMKDADGDSIGKIVVYSDVTQNRMLIERLENKAGVDSLTGIPNHMAYVGAKTRLDVAANLPLSVIMCDANRLKQVNDTRGHQYGDLMLQIMADILEDECPSDGFVARIGGDEFIFLLPHTTLEDAQHLADDLRRRLKGTTQLPFTLSMAFGAATKEEEAQELSDIIRLADERMYEDKNKGRKPLATPTPQ